MNTVFFLMMIFNYDFNVARRKEGASDARSHISASSCFSSENYLQFLSIAIPMKIPRVRVF
jgi:hypothetical protein